MIVLSFDKVKLMNPGIEIGLNYQYPTMYGIKAIPKQNIAQLTVLHY